MHIYGVYHRISWGLRLCSYVKLGSTIGFCGSMGLRRGCSSWGLRFCPLDLKCCPRLFSHPSGVHRDGAARWGLSLGIHRSNLMLEVISKVPSSKR